MTTAAELFAAGWRVVSRAHLIAARLPPGETGKQALARHDAKLARALSEYDAADHYRRMCAERDVNWIQISSGVMRELVRLKQAEDDILLRCPVPGCTRLKISTGDDAKCSKHHRAAKRARRR